MPTVLGTRPTATQNSPLPPLAVAVITGLPVVLKFLKFLKCHRCPEIVPKLAIVLKFYSFGQSVLIWTLVFKFVAARWHLLRLKCTKFDFG